MKTPTACQELGAEELSDKMRVFLPVWLEALADSGRSRETIRRYKSATTAFLDWLGQRRPTQRLLVEYLDHLQLERGLRPRTIHTSFAALSSFRDYLASQGFKGLPDVRAVPLPPLDKSTRATPTLEECQLMLDALPMCGSHAADPSYRDYLRGRAGALLALGLLCGLRRDEIFHVDLGDLKNDHNGRQLYVRKGKRRNSRTVPMNTRCWELVNDWLKVRAVRLKMHGKLEQTALLIDDRGRRMGYRSADAVMRELFAFAKLEKMGFTLHSWRHGFATLMLQAGVDVETLRELLGHTDVRTTYLYTHTDHKALRRAVESLDVFLAPVSRPVSVPTSGPRRREPMQTAESGRRLVRRSARE